MNNRPQLIVPPQRSYWVTVANNNLALATEHGIDHDGQVFHGDAHQLSTLLPAELRGQAALVVTSPPYGPSTHGRVAVAPGEGIQKYFHQYGSTLDRGNLANIGHHRLLSGFTRILTALTGFMRPGGHIAITVRPWREHAELIDLPSQILTCGRNAGLIPVERCVALLARVAEHDFLRKQREAGLASTSSHRFKRSLPCACRACRTSATFASPTGQRSPRSMSSPSGSPDRRSPPLDNARASRRERAVECGSTSWHAFAYYDRSSSSWRTSPRSAGGTAAYLPLGPARPDGGRGHQVARQGVLTPGTTGPLRRSSPWSATARPGGWWGRNR